MVPAARPRSPASWRIVGSRAPTGNAPVRTRCRSWSRTCRHGATPLSGRRRRGVWSPTAASEHVLRPVRDPDPERRRRPQHAATARPIPTTVVLETGADDGQRGTEPGEPDPDRYPRGPQPQCRGHGLVGHRRPAHARCTSRPTTARHPAAYPIPIQPVGHRYGCWHGDGEQDDQPHQHGHGPERPPRHEVPPAAGVQRGAPDPARPAAARRSARRRAWPPAVARRTPATAAGRRRVEQPGEWWQAEEQDHVEDPALPQVANRLAGLDVVRSGMPQVRNSRWPLPGWATSRATARAAKATATTSGFEPVAHFVPPP